MIQTKNKSSLLFCVIFGEICRVTMIL